MCARLVCDIHINADRRDVNATLRRLPSTTEMQNKEVICVLYLSQGCYLLEQKKCIHVASNVERPNNFRLLHLGVPIFK